MNALKSIFVIALLAVSSASHATTISFNLTGAGYTQDSAVATNLFAASGLMLSSGVVTACGGACISSPANDYTGMIVGNFMGSAYSSLYFDAVIGNAAVNLFDINSQLVTTLTDSNNYTYAGTTGVASWSANLQYDGFYSMSFDNAVAVPEPGSMALFGLSLAALGFARRKANKA